MAEDAIQKLAEQERAVKERAAAELAKIKAKRQAIQQRAKTKERKERTHRLIQMGALIEKYFGFCTPQEVEAFCQLNCADEQQKQQVVDAVKQKVVQNMIGK